MSSILDPLYDSTQYKVSSSVSSTANATGTDRFQDLGTESFLKLMVAELQNQDPMNPTDNAQMLQQINQIREISSNDKLSTSLDAVLLGQNMATAAGLLGQTVTGVDTLGEKVTGTVDHIVFENGTPKLYVGTSILEVGNVTQINTAGQSVAAPPANTGSGDNPSDLESGDSNKDEVDSR
ncbi:MAG: hypothetical protein LBQ54_16435 [Planctomycetaceae bacterium]|jgi:flagellar basal-body rod modification protein FlgD|nr:hypothetical protein [Planctomycetaceae bacterium]